MAHVEDEPLSGDEQQLVDDSHFVDGEEEDADDNDEQYQPAAAEADELEPEFDDEALDESQVMRQAPRGDEDDEDAEGAYDDAAALHPGDGENDEEEELTEEEWQARALAEEQAQERDEAEEAARRVLASTAAMALADENAEDEEDEARAAAEAATYDDPDAAADDTQQQPFDDAHLQPFDDRAQLEQTDAQEEATSPPASNQPSTLTADLREAQRQVHAARAAERTRADRPPLGRSELDYYREKFLGVKLINSGKVDVQREGVRGLHWCLPSDLPIYSENNCEHYDPYQRKKFQFETNNQNVIVWVRYA